MPEQKKERKSVAERAYELWEKAGKPHGQDLEHWFQAEIELAKKGTKPRAKSSETLGKRGGAPKVTAIVKERPSSRNSSRNSGRKK